VTPYKQRSAGLDLLEWCERSRTTMQVEHSGCRWERHSSSGQRLWSCRDIHRTTRTTDTPPGRLRVAQPMRPVRGRRSQRPSERSCRLPSVSSGHGWLSCVDSHYMTRPTVHFLSNRVGGTANENGQRRAARATLRALMLSKLENRDHTMHIKQRLSYAYLTEYAALHQPTSNTYYLLAQQSSRRIYLAHTDTLQPCFPRPPSSSSSSPPSRATQPHAAARKTSSTAARHS